MQRSFFFFSKQHKTNSHPLALYQARIHQVSLSDERAPNVAGRRRLNPNNNNTVLLLFFFITEGQLAMINQFDDAEIKADSFLFLLAFH